MIYAAIIIIGLVIWLVYTFLTGASNTLTVSLIGIIAFVVVLLGARNGYRRGWQKETYFAAGLIILYWAKDIIRDSLLGLFNGIARLVITQLNNRGITTINYNSVVLDANGRALFNIIIFVAGTIITYAIVSGKPKGPPPKPGEKPPEAKEVFGLIIGGVSAILFMMYLFKLADIFLNPTIAAINGAMPTFVKDLPSINLPTIQTNRQAAFSPFAGWEFWLPAAFVGAVIVYVVYKRYIAPPTKASVKLNTRGIFGLALLLAIILVMALVGART